MKYKNYNLPDELLYNKDSSWVKVKDDIATIGIIEPVAKALKEFIFVELPEKKSVKKGDVYVSLEALKWSGHLTSPLTGDIVEVNDELAEEPGKINENPYKSWVMKIKINKNEELDELYKAKEIKSWLDETLEGE